MGETGSWTGVAVFLGLSPMAVAMVLNVFEGEGLLAWGQGSCLLFYESIRKWVEWGKRRTLKKTLRRGQKSETTMDEKRREWVRWTWTEKE